MAAKTDKQRSSAYRKRQELRGFTKLNTYVEPETKRQLFALAKEEGSVDAALQKLLKQAQGQQQAA